jgi:hypothetical protein
MSEWWSSLSSATQVFYGIAAFFSAIFAWQFIASLMGLAGETEVDVDTDVDIDTDGLDLDDIEAHGIEEAGETVVAFKMLSLRAIMAFCMMFSWAVAMYTDGGMVWRSAIFRGALWGLAGWVLVAVLVYLIRRMAETGNQQLASCVGTEGSVYLDIPADGTGEVRVTVSGVVSCVKARSKGSQALSSGTLIKVTRKLGPTTVEVTAIKDD